MEAGEQNHSCLLDKDEPLSILLEGTAAAIGEGFFETLVENLAKALHTKCAWVTEYFEKERRLKALAFWVQGQFIPDFSIAIDNSPCEAVIGKARLVHYPDNILELFPDSSKLKELEAVSYLGIPLMDLDGSILGQMAVIDSRPMPKEPKNLAFFQIFAARAAAELRRMRADAEAREHREKLSRLVESAMDAIIELDEDLNITLLNPAAGTILSLPPNRGQGHNFIQYLDDNSRRKVNGLIRGLGRDPHSPRSLWVAGGLNLRNTNGQTVAAEATLSRSEMRGKAFFTIILRNINERIQANKEIRWLKEEADYLKAEIRSLDNLEEIIGRSPGILKALGAVDQVAATNATVLVLGETGTGKELIARAIHNASRRTGMPFIKVNCAALPVALLESELFGHEPGAFTGAQRQRKGRFELAHGGTLFLDEICEMPLASQVKLLHVLQEGRFERLGASHPIKVDVRIVAATHRDFNREILAGRFRADLFYRIHVYPIELPPLRERREDIPLLVRYFVSRISKRIGKKIDRIAADDMDQMMSYTWPGNIRELKNVIERAIITSHDHTLVLPEALTHQPSQGPDPAPGSEFSTLEALERQHITHVLQSNGWRISGPRGAAEILGLNPSTLRYRIKKLSIARPWRFTRSYPRA